ncbi:GDSL esterase/lipase At1g71250-like [Aristolochia californica]|uniref:GDSL esterase/lipase At1g71250-like n=1 Tax=Aristolochia californica TaxID=171875 RepID=UPI0035D56940
MGSTISASGLLFFCLLVIAIIIFRRRPVLALVDGGSSLSAFFVLGDSSVNCGNNLFLYPFLRPNSSSYFCNFMDRKLIPDLIAEKMGLPISPLFYRQNGTMEGLMGGLNYGSSPATIMNYGWRDFQGLNAQARQVFETLQLVQLQLGSESANRLIRSSLFYLSFGKDDYLEFFRSFSGTNPNITAHKFARILANQMIRIVKDLYNANVRKIVCVGIGPLGCSPRSLWEAFNSTGRSRTSGRCIRKINKKVTVYNQILSASINDLNCELKDSQIVFCDIYRAMMNLIRCPRIYGFENVDGACCGVGRYGGMVGCLAKELACTDHSKHVWWDLYNPTEAANAWIAEWMWSGTHPSNICGPINIKQLMTNSVWPPLEAPSFN